MRPGLVWCGLHLQNWTGLTGVCKLVTALFAKGITKNCSSMAVMVSMSSLSIVKLAGWFVTYLCPSGWWQRCKGRIAQDSLEPRTAMARSADLRQAQERHQILHTSLTTPFMNLSSKVRDGSPASGSPASPPTAQVVSLPYTVQTDQPAVHPTARA